MSRPTTIWKVKNRSINKGYQLYIVTKGKPFRSGDVFIRTMPAFKTEDHLHGFLIARSYQETLSRRRNKRTPRYTKLLDFSDGIYTWIEAEIPQTWRDDLHTSIDTGLPAFG